MKPLIDEICVLYGTVFLHVNLKDCDNNLFMSQVGSRVLYFSLTFGSSFLLQAILQIKSAKMNVC